MENSGRSSGREFSAAMTGKNVTKAKALLFQMSEILLVANPGSEWAKILSYLARETYLFEEGFWLKVKRLFGGMGSINDVVVMRQDGTVDVKSSDEFDEIRKQLFSLVYSNRT